LKEYSRNLYSFNDAFIGKVAVGIISDIDIELGLRIHFYNGVNGIIPLNILRKQGVKDIDTYRVGQVINTVVLGKYHNSDIHMIRKSNHDILILALELCASAQVVQLLSQELALISNGNKNLLGASDMKPNGFNLENQTSSPFPPIEVLNIVSGTIEKVEIDGYRIMLEHGMVGILHKYNCCDFAMSGEKLFQSNRLVVGMRIENLIVLSNSNNSAVTLSMKPLLCSALGFSKHFLFGQIGDSSQLIDRFVLPKNCTELMPGQVVVGCVSRVEDFGVLVKFIDDFVALIPRPNISDRFVTSPVGIFTVGDSIRCVVQRVDQNKDRVILTCKSMYVPNSKGSTCYLNRFLIEEYLFSSSQFNEVWPRYPVGAIVQANIKFM
jgi:ribosomal protein S1